MQPLIKKSVSDSKNRSPSAGIKWFTRAEIITRDSKKLAVKSNALADVKEKNKKPTAAGVKQKKPKAKKK